MGNYKVINIAATEFRPELEERINHWYNESHIPMFLKYQGVKRVSRSKRISGDKTLPQYIAVFEFEDKETMQDYLNSPERAKALEGTKETWKDNDIKVIGITQYELIQSWDRQT